MLSCLTWLFLYSYLYFLFYSMQRKQLKAIVQCLLETIPETRDNDPLLYKEVAKNYFTEVPYFMLDIYELLTKLNYQSIRAIRQNLQLRNESLRGKEWNKRHNLGEELRKEYSPTFQELVDAKAPRYQQ